LIYYVSRKPRFDVYEKKSFEMSSLPILKVLPGQTSYSINWEISCTSFRRNYRIDAHHEGFQQASKEDNNSNKTSLTSKNYLKHVDGESNQLFLKSSLHHFRSWNGIKMRKLTQQEKNFTLLSFVRKHPNFDVFNPLYSLSQISDSKLVRIWTMLFDNLKNSAKSDLSQREGNLLNKWELATIVLSKENQNGPMSGQLRTLCEIQERRLPKEIEKIKFILLNFLNKGIQRNNEFLKSQIMHGSSPFAVFTHHDDIIANLSNRLGSMPLNNISSRTALTSRIAWIASKFSCTHTTIWSHLPDGSSSLQPHVIWSCPLNRASCDGVMASMLIKNMFVLDLLCKFSCQVISSNTSSVIIKEETYE